MRQIARHRFAFFGISVAIPCLIIFPFFGTSVSAIEQGAPAQANVNSQKTPTASGLISGHVYRADTGAPVVKAQVTLIPVTKTSMNVTGERRFTLTDADGGYAFTQVASGTYTVGAGRNGFISRYFDDVWSPADARILSLNSNEALERIDLRLICAGAISGAVFDEDNQPLMSVQVEAVRIRFMPEARRLEAPGAIVMTNDLGEFRLYNLPPGNYFVRILTSTVNPQTGKQVLRLAYYPNTSTIENAQAFRLTGGNEIDGVRFSVGLTSSYSISGNIIDATGSAGKRRYEVTVHRVNTGERAAPSTLTMDGTFAVLAMTPGDYLLTASSTLQGPDSQLNGQPRDVSGFAIAHVADGDAHVNIQVNPEAEVSGKVLIENPKGQTTSGMLIALWPQLPILGTGPNMIHSEIDRNGAFKIQYLPSGTYDFGSFDASGMYLKKIICGGKDYTLLPITIESGVSVTDCSVTLGTDAGVVKGQVLDGEKPMSGLTVVAIPEQRSLRHLDRFTVIGRTNANGEYQLPGVIPGDYLLFAVPADEGESYFDLDFADRNQRDAERVSVKSGETKTVQLKPTTPQ